MTSLFLNSRNDLRTIWKFAAFLAVLLPVWIASSLAMRLLFHATFASDDQLHELALDVLINLIPAVVATLFAARIVEHLPLLAFGMGLHSGWYRDLGAGFGVAAWLIGLTMLGTLFLGDTHLEWTASQTAPGRMALTLGILIVAAAFEELIFRGYPLQLLIKGIGPWPAMIVLSCIFGLLHAMNPNASHLGIFNTIVAGMMLSLAYLKTRSLWFPYGLHLAWNVGTGMVVGFPLSGLGVTSLWTTHVTGSPTLLGGEYGPEGGVLGTAIFLAGTLLVWKLPIKETNYIEYDHRLH